MLHLKMREISHMTYAVCVIVEVEVRNKSVKFTQNYEA